MNDDKFNNGLVILVDEGSVSLEYKDVYGFRVFTFPLTECSD